MARRDYQVNLADASDGTSADTKITVTVMAGSTTMTTVYTVTVTRIAADNARLTKLELSDVELVFMPDTFIYTASVDNDLDDDGRRPKPVTTVVATPVMGASVQLILPLDADGAMAGHQVALSAGTDPTDTTEITVTVLAADGKSSETYTVTVTRTGSDDTTLKSLSLSGATLSAPTVGGDGNVTYTATVPHGIAQTTVTAMATHAEAEAVITPADANEDMAGHQVNLGVGDRRHHHYHGDGDGGGRVGGHPHGHRYAGSGS